MRRILPFILILAICLSLCACGKSEEVKAVEEKISSIGEISIDSTDLINDARDAYNALSDEDKEKVENASILREATFESLVIRCAELNRQSSILAEGVIITWENVGGSDFWKYFDDVLRFTDSNIIEGMKLLNELSDVQLCVWHAGFAMNKNEFGNGGKYFHYWDYTDEVFTYVTNMCMPYAKANVVLPEMEPALNDDVTQFVKDYKNEYTEETDLLKEWMLESSMFVEFATEPSGKLDAYKVQLTEYENTMSRFQKEAKMLK